MAPKKELSSSSSRRRRCASFSSIRRREVGINRHLLAGDRIEGEAGADFGDTRGTLGMTMKFTVIRMRKTMRPITKSPDMTRLAKPEMTPPAAPWPSCPWKG